MMTRTPLALRARWRAASRPATRQHPDNKPHVNVGKMILTYLEFYSGVGGWGYALEAACRSLSASFVYDEAAASKRPRVAVSPPEPDEGGVTTQASARLLAAFDHSDLCNGVFQHNHKDIGKRCKPRQTPIERLSLDELEQYDATVWCLSPPVRVGYFPRVHGRRRAPSPLTFFDVSASRIHVRCVVSNPTGNRFASILTPPCIGV